MTQLAQGKTTIAIDPVTRIEGHLKAEVVVENGKVVDARLTGGMYRGFESILHGRHPRDAVQIVQRICGVCPTAHATASSMALEKVCGTRVPANGRITRNLTLGANYLQSHLLHFYHLAGQDFIQGPNVAPFTPRYARPDLRLPPAINAEGVDQYLQALEVRQVCHEMVALFGGRMPHVHGILAGGAAEIPSREKILEYAARFKKVRAFVEEKYLPVVYLVGSQYKDLSAQVLVFSFLHVPALVEIAAVCPGEVRRVVDYHRPLPLEKLVQLQVGLGIDRIAEQLGDKAPFQFLAVNQDIVFSKVPGNISERRGRLGVHLEHQPGDVCCGRVRDHHFRADALNGSRLQLEAERSGTAHVETTLAPGIVSVGHPLLDCLALQLGKHNADIQHGPAHWGGRVKLFRRGDKLHIVLLEQLHHGCEV